MFVRVYVYIYMLTLCTPVGGVLPLISEARFHYQGTSYGINCGQSNTEVDFFGVFRVFRARRHPTEVLYISVSAAKSVGGPTNWHGAKFSILVGTSPLTHTKLGSR